MRRPLRVPVEHVATGEHELDGDAASYVARVHRLAAGAKIVVFDPAAAIEAEAEILAIDKRGVRIAVREPRPASVRATREITLIQAVGKGDKMDAIVRDATELGATRIVPAIAERSVRRPDASRVERWRRIVVEAARQSGRGDAPRVEDLASFEAAVFRDAPRVGGVGLCFAPEAATTLGEALASLEPGRAVTIGVGPEGGLTAAEVELAVRAGFAPTSLGPFVLRTETVCAAVLGALLARA
jgi:16S rRNA (uracil1498-N3)-methyltransferase